MELVYKNEAGGGIPSWVDWYFSQNFSVKFLQKPTSTIVSLTDWQDDTRRSVWYNCKSYRINLYAENVYRDYGYSVKLVNGRFAKGNIIYMEENQLFINLT